MKARMISVMTVGGDGPMWIADHEFKAGKHVHMDKAELAYSLRTAKSVDELKVLCETHEVEVKFPASGHMANFVMAALNAMAVEKPAAKDAPKTTSGDDAGDGVKDKPTPKKAPAKKAPAKKGA
jgi:hypothetical protein